MWTAVQGLRKEGITVVLTTHYMEEADELSDRVAIVDRGKMLALGTPQQLKDTHGAETMIDLKLRNIEGAEAVAVQLRHRNGVARAEKTAEGLCVPRGQRRWAAAGDHPGQREPRFARCGHHRAEPRNGLHSTHGEGPA